MPPNEFSTENTGADLVLNAAIRAVQLDEAEQTRLLRVINRNHARSPLEAEQVFIFPGVLSNQAIDFYGTRMAPNSLKNYLRDVRAGIALMVAHRTGELPVGRIFEGALEGDPLKPGSVGFDDQRGQELLIYSYMQRGLSLSGLANNNDLIAGVEGGSIKDMSITFTWHPDGMLRCSVCGNDFRNYQECPHFPFQTYEAEGGPQRQFIWVENGRALEGSMVYDGATPGAMIRKLEWGVGEGLLGSESVDFFENRFQCNLRGSKTSPAKVPAGEMGKPSHRSAGKEKIQVNFENLFRILEEAGMGADQVETLRSVEPQEALDRGATFLAERVEALQEAHANLADDAKLGRETRETLVSEAVSERIRAQGDQFDAEKYRAFLMASNDLVFIRSEKETWAARAAEVFRGGPGRTRQAPTPEANERRLPASAYS